MKNQELERKIRKYNINKGEGILEDLAYLCFIDGYEIIILTSEKKEKVGGILRCGISDIHFTIFPKHRGKHYLSNFLRTGIMQQIWKENNQISLIPNAINNIDDYNTKMHLVELTGYTLTNEEQVKRYVNYICR